jgi:dihydrofolate synthase/folylpolyglutamate synthase
VAADPLIWLFGLEQFGIKLGLDNIRTLTAALGNPERTFRAIHVAGTNGKGSVTAIVDAVLRAAGHRVGRYTSPHLRHLTERFTVHGAPVSEQALAAVVAELQHTAGELTRRGTLEVLPTFFEVTTAAAFELFRRAEVDFAVCEVGLGGRLDATNVLEPMVSVITSVAFDHQHYLGSTLAEIAREKAGIVKRGVPVIVGNVPDEAAGTIERVAEERGAPIVWSARGSEVRDIRTGKTGTTFVLRTPARDYGRISLGLAGRHQVANAVLAVRTLEALAGRGVDVAAEAIVAGLAGTRWPGRLDLRRLPGGREVLLDAAHNEEGAAALARFLAEVVREKQPLVFAVMKDKDMSAMLTRLAPVVSSLICTRASSPRSTDPDAIAAQARALGPALPIVVEPQVGRALAAAWSMAPRIVAAGSIFLLGDVLGVVGDP